MKIFKIAGTTSIAAALIVMVTMLVLSNSATKLSAAEVFAQVKKACSEYEGWICVESSNPNASGSAIVNTVTNFIVLESRQNNNLTINYRDASKNISLAYNEADNTITTFDNTAEHTIEMVEILKKQLRPDSMIKLLSTEMAMDISYESTEQFDILTMTITGAAEDKTLTGYEPKSLKVYADPQTRLVQKIEGTGPQGQPVFMTFSYEKPKRDISSIYSFGAAKDAKIVSSVRMAPEENKKEE